MREANHERPVLSFDAFWAFLAESLRLDLGSVADSTRLSDEIGMDSLQMIELMFVMDDLGAEMHEDLMPAIQTAGDLYHHYATRASVRPST